MKNEIHKRLYSEIARGNFEKILSEINLVSSLIHNGEKGKESEEVLKHFLKEYLPKKYEVTTGFVQSDMGLSNQSDILIYDANNYPPIYFGYVNQIIPMPSLRAVIECTMRLNKKKIEDDNKKIHNLKTLYRKDEEIQNSMSREPLAILFAYRSEGKILENLNRLEEKNFDIVFCADGQLYILSPDIKTYTNNLVDNLYSGETVHGYTYTKEQHAFSLFYSFLVDYLNEITSKYDKYRMVMNYSRSSINIDYKKY